MNRNGYLAISLIICLAAPAEAEPRRGEFEVHDLSLWITDGAVPLANARASFPSSFPVTVQSLRAQRSSLATREPGPVGLITFHGRPADELDVELRVTSGSFVGHWPPGESRRNRLRWPSGDGVALVEQLEDESVLMWVDEDHWFHRARQSDALFVHRGARAERFLAYEAELKLSSPIRLQGGPDKFTIANASDATLYDVVVARLTPEGVRVAWLDELPKAGVKQSSAAKPSNPAKPAVGLKAQPPAADQAKRTAGLFGSGKKPPAGDAEAPKGKEAPNKQAGGKAAKDKSGGKLFGLAVPKSAPGAAGDNGAKKHPATGLFGAKRLPALRATGANSRPLAGGVELALSDPLPAGSDEAKAATSGELAERYQRAGLSAGEIEVFLGQYSSMLFESESLIVACRLSPSAIDSGVTLSVFPVPTKIVRVPVVLVRNVDPQLPQQIDRLIAQLGGADFGRREMAEKQLTKLGPLAFESLKKAINHKDMEIVIRAERILLNQGQEAAGRQGASGD